MRVTLEEVEIGDLLLIVVDPQRVSGIDRELMFGRPWVYLTLDRPQSITRSVYPSGYCGHAQASLTLVAKELISQPTFGFQSS